MPTAHRMPPHADSTPTARRRMHTARPPHAHRTRTARPCLSTRRVSYARQVLRRATEAGSGVLSVGRPWVRHEGWLLKESGGPMSSYQPTLTLTLSLPLPLTLT